MSLVSRFIVISFLFGFTAYMLYPSINYYLLTDANVRTAFEQDNLGQEESVSISEEEKETLQNNFSRIVKPGLDLKGGLFMVLLIDFEKLREIRGQEEEISDELKQESIEQVMNRIQNRIDVAGVSEITMRKEGVDRILVQIPGETSSSRVENIIATTGQLEFKMVNEGFSAELGNTPWADIQTNQELKERIEVADKQIAPQFARNVLGEQELVGGIVLDKQVEISGEMLSTASLAYSEIGEAVVSFTLNGAGASKFAKITAENIGRRFAIVLDGEVISAPSIRESIPGGQAQISGGFSQEEARDLALILRAGSLPAPVSVISKEIVGAKLGEELRNRAIRSLVIALCAVLVFMLLFYRFSGIIACIGLLVNGTMVLAFLSSFGLSLSLSGVAGLLLTIGMSIDANVIIFERIKEEYRIDKETTLPDLVRYGYSRAFWSIFDANITTLIAAFVLFYYGSGALQGFATTLFFGIVVSMFSSLFFTRFLFEFVLQTSLFKKYSRIFI